MMQTRETKLLWRRRKRRFFMEALYCYSKLYTALIIIGCLTLLPQGITAQYNNNNNDDLYIVKPTPALRLGKEASHDLHKQFQHLDSGQNKAEVNKNLNTLISSHDYRYSGNSEEDHNDEIDEARYNLATRIMSNGVEVIIASDKTKTPDLASDISNNQIQQYNKPVTLAASTIKNQMMILLLPSSVSNNVVDYKSEELMQEQNANLPFHTNYFITKTCFTTYTYRTTFIDDGQTTVESRERVVSNIATEERSYPKITPSREIGITLTRTPELAVGVFPTTYSYYNTYKDASNKLHTITSDYTIINTLTGPNDYIDYLQHTAKATPALKTNTYYNEVNFTVVDKSDVMETETVKRNLTQVVVTKSYRKPIHNTDVLTSYYTYDMDENGNNFAKNPILVQNEEDDHSDKNYLSETSAINKTDILDDIQLYATKIFLKTLTYYTSTVLNTQLTQTENSQTNAYGKTPSTLFNYYTRVIQNTVTDSVEPTLLPTELLAEMKTELKKQKQKNQYKRGVFVTTATLSDGQTLEISAIERFKDNLSVIFPTTTATSIMLSNNFQISNENEENELLQNDENNNTITSLPSEKILTIANVPNNSAFNPSSTNNILSDNNSNSTKSTTNQLIKHLTAIKPVLNAMADLLQNNFGLNRETESIKNIESDTNSYKKNNYTIDSKHPIYIPVQNLPNKNNFNEISNYSTIKPQNLFIKPPINVNEEIIFDENNNKVFSEKHSNLLSFPTLTRLRQEQPLQNGGIFIRPGEIITANSDVIVGKPNGIEYVQMQNTDPNNSNNDFTKDNRQFQVTYYHNTVQHPYRKKPQSHRPQHIPVSDDKVLGLRPPIEPQFNKNILKPPPLPSPHSLLFPSITSNAPPYGISLVLTAPIKSSRIRNNNSLDTTIPNTKHYTAEIESSLELKPNLLNSPGHEVKGYNFQQTLKNNEESNAHLINSVGNDKKHSQINVNKFQQNFKSNEILEIKNIPQIFSFEVKPSSSLSPLNKYTVTNRTPYLNMHTVSNYYVNPDNHYKQNTFTEFNVNYNIMHTQTSSPLQSNVTTLPKISSIFSPTKNFSSTSPRKPLIDQYNRKSISRSSNNTNIKIKNSLNFSTPSVKLEHTISTQKFNVNNDLHVNQNDFIKPFQKIKPFNSPAPSVPTTNHPHFYENLKPNIAFQKESFIRNYQNINLDPPTTVRPVLYENPKPSTSFIKDSTTKNSKNISLDQHTFSHTVNVNVPPLTFNREDLYYPQQILTNEQKTQVKPSYKYMPLITFPASKQNVQVNLTPINTVGSLKSPANKLTLNNEMMPINKIVHDQNSLESNNNNIINITPKRVINFVHYGRQQEHVWNNKTNANSNYNSTYKYNHQANLTTFKPIQNVAQIKAENRKILTTKTTQTPTIENVFDFKDSIQNSSKLTSIYKSELSNNKISNSPKHNMEKSDIFLQEMKEFDDKHDINKITQRNVSSSGPVEEAVDVNEVTNINVPKNVKIQTSGFIGQKGIPFSNIPREKQIKISNRTASILVALGEAFRIPTDKQLPSYQRNRLSTTKATTTTTNKPKLIATKDKEYNNNFTTNIENFEVAETQYNHGEYQTNSNENSMNININNKYLNNNPVKTNSTKEKVFELHKPINISTISRISNQTNVDAKDVDYSYVKSLKPTKSLDDAESANPQQTNITQLNTSKITSIYQNNDNNLQILNPQKIEITEVNKPSMTSDQQISEYNVGILNTQQTNITKVLPPAMNSINTPTNTATEIYYDKRYTSESNNKQFNNLLPSEVYKEQQILNTITRPLSTSMLTLTTTIKRIILPTKYITNNNLYNETKTIPQTSPSVIIRSTTSFLSTTETLFLTHTQINTIVNTVTSIKTLNPITITTTTTLKHLVSLNTNSLNLNVNNTLQTLKSMATQEITYLPYPTVEIVSTNITHNSSNHKSNEDNIFVVMTNNNKKDTILTIPPEHHQQQDHSLATHIQSTMPSSPHSYDNELKELDKINNEMLLVYDNDITFDDENIPINSNEVNEHEQESIKINFGQPFSLSDNIADNKENAPEDHIILGGVLIATPPKSSNKKNTFNVDAVDCSPQCKSSRNEQCTVIDDYHSMCLCRPGFARMFPDRPCKPTYTYSLIMHVERIGNYPLQYMNELKDNKTEYYKQLTQLVKNALDRMVMQSDFRDAYHGAEVKKFLDDHIMHHGILVDVLLQLSDNSNEKRLEDVFKKNLRLSNYSIGGTDLYTNVGGVDALSITDFNECVSIKFHDCSENAHCFNLLGTYTCSCFEGYVDLSNNPIYPGRICSSDQIGCEKCNFHGKCFSSDDRNYCECFQWYAGSNCQVNLKILLIVLLGIGSLLFILLLFCILITCTKRRNNLQHINLAPSTLTTSSSDGSKQKSRAADNILITGVGIISSIGGDTFKIDRRQKSLQIDTHSMIKDSSSETSQNSLPYVLKNRETTSSISNSKQTKCHSNADGNKYRFCSARENVPKNCSITGQPNDQALLDEKCKKSEQHKFLENGIEFDSHYCEQSDRSLTVMIPRAKYHSSVLSQTQLMHHQLTMERIYKKSKPENN